MPGKRKKRKLTLRSRIVSLLSEKGRMKLGNMAKILGASSKSLNTEALELRRLGVLQKDDEGVWSLVPGVDPTMFGIEPLVSERGGSNGGVSTTSTPLETEGLIPFKNEFIDLLKSTGVKTGAEVIADLYLNGDNIWDMRWLHYVLSDCAKGFVTEGQCKLIMAAWAIGKGVRYKHEDFFKD
jgi:hypothetical protein